MGDDTTRKVFWEGELDERQQAHIQFCRVYAQHYHHGAPGHLDMMLIAELAQRLDAALLELADLKAKP